jgi:hypothetical protein
VSHVLRNNSRHTWRHREGARNVHNPTIHRALSLSHHAGGARRASTVPPRRGTDAAPHREPGHPSGRTREEKAPKRFKIRAIRVPPADPLFASRPWPRC